MNRRRRPPVGIGQGAQEVWASGTMAITSRDFRIFRTDIDNA